MKIIKPKKLKKGDVIGIISPASSPSDLSRIEKGVKYLESLGYRTEVGKNVGKYYGYLAGVDEERVEDIHYMFSNKNINAIICLRGGYGSGRLLDKIDYSLIKKNPKIFCGYSDITALQLAFFAKAGLVTFAGPMLAVDFYDEVREYTEEIFWKLVTSTKKFGKVKNPDHKELNYISKGKAEGIVLGGNLALITSLMGTEYFPNLKEKILLIEEVEEAPYRLDRMLNQLKLSNAFQKLNGILLGEFCDCVDNDENAKTLTVDEVMIDYFGELKIPVIFNLQHGHIKDNITIPIGTNIKIDSKKNIVEFLEPAVE